MNANIIVSLILSHTRITANGTEFQTFARVWPETHVLSELHKRSCPSFPVVLTGVLPGLSLKAINVNPLLKVNCDFISFFKNVLKLILS